MKNKEQAINNIVYQMDRLALFYKENRVKWQQFYDSERSIFSIQKRRDKDVGVLRYKLSLPKNFQEIIGDPSR